MITNTGNQSVDISDWILDDITMAEAPCRIGWNTNRAGESITSIEQIQILNSIIGMAILATLLNADGNLIDSMTYPGRILVGQGIHHCRKYSFGSRTQSFRASRNLLYRIDNTRRIIHSQRKNRYDDWTGCYR